MPRTKYLRQRTKIVCTIGPACHSPVMIERLVKAGMNVARLNLSHGTLPEHAQIIADIRAIAQRLDIPVAILLDLPGPKYRTGKLKSDSVLLKRGSQITLTTQQLSGDQAMVSVNLPAFPQEVKPGDKLLLDDGAMELRVQEVIDSEVRCKVIVGGRLIPGRGIAIPGRHISTPFVTPKLKEYIAFAVQQQPDYIALSFVSQAMDIKQVKDILRLENADIPVVSKIERGQAVGSFDRILAESDGVMVARGDLGVDIPLQKVPLVQKEIIKKCNRASVPVITATQMLESMIKAPHPTRAEVTDVANAIFDGTDAIMLSAETAVGNYPIQSVTMMAQIAREAENKLPYEQWLMEKSLGLEPKTDEAISYDACHTAHQLGAVAIVAFTQSGSTARRVSKYRPRVPILAITSSQSICRRLQLFWGVHPFRITQPSSISELFAFGAKLARDLDLAKPDDLVVITGGIPLGIAGTTNLLKVERIT